MGYSLTIGELEIKYINDEDEPRINFFARGEKHESAPAFNEPTDHTNERWPSYSVWSNFCHSVGLYELFYGKSNNGELVREDAILSSHPGCIPLTEKHRREINSALEAFKTKHPNAKPTYGEPQEHFWDTDPDNPKENSAMCRLVWLHYWVNWALDNCEKPVFENS